MKRSTIHMHQNGRLTRKRGPAKVSSDSKLNYDDLRNLGLGVRALDAALTGPATSNGIMLQHMLQTWLPGTLRVITQVRNIDEIIGITTVGSWDDELISLRTAEPAGHAELYGDTTNIPLADYRQDTVHRTVVRFEQGFQVGKLEEARQGRIGYQAVNEKRQAADESLDISRNRVGFYGFNSDDTNVYGLLNEPSLSAYLTPTASWIGANFIQLTGDFIRLVNQLETQMGGHLQDTDPLVLVLPMGYRSVMSTFSETGSGLTFRQWLNENYPNLRIVITPEFVGANGGLDVAYLFVENAGGIDGDNSDVTSATAIQAVPVRYQVLGSENRVKGYIEDAINATAGIFIIRPWAFARMTISD